MSVSFWSLVDSCLMGNHTTSSFFIMTADHHCVHTGTIMVQQPVADPEIFMSAGPPNFPKKDCMPPGPLLNQSPDSYKE